MSASDGPPPLRPFGLVLRRDGSFRHEGLPITNRRLRAVFERGVCFLPDEAKYVVVLGRFRGEIEIEEVGFFVRSVELDSGEIALSDGSRERLDPASLRPSELDDGWLCTVKRELVSEGLPARFTPAAWAELVAALEEDERGFALRIAGRLHPVPDPAATPTRPREP
ncbi:hypothetical protein MYXO_00715 [Myxococcaceae bacterium]|nr:hypothetical protein MYXO_00715 [Myxococcaceae bacterium]